MSNTLNYVNVLQYTEVIHIQGDSKRCLSNKGLSFIFMEKYSNFIFLISTWPSEHTEEREVTVNTKELEVDYMSTRNDSSDSDDEEVVHEEEYEEAVHKEEYQCAKITSAAPDIFEYCSRSKSSTVNGDKKPLKKRNFSMDQNQSAVENVLTNNKEGKFFLMITIVPYKKITNDIDT